MLPSRGHGAQWLDSRQKFWFLKGITVEPFGGGFSTWLHKSTLKTKSPEVEVVPVTGRPTMSSNDVVLRCHQL